jgi:hypothetical protein
MLKVTSGHKWWILRLFEIGLKFRMLSLSTDST